MDILIITKERKKCVNRSRIKLVNENLYETNDNVIYAWILNNNDRIQLIMF